MPVSEDLLNVKFEKSGFGGYKTAEVDNYVYEVSQTMGRLKTEVTDLKRKLDNTVKKLKDFEDGEESVKLALIKAQRLADETIKSAQDHADAVLKEAQEKADTLMNEAISKSTALISKAEYDIVYRREESVHIKQETSEFCAKMLEYLNAHLELLKSIPCEEPPYITDTSAAQIEVAAAIATPDFGTSTVTPPVFKTENTPVNQNEPLMTTEVAVETEASAVNTESKQSPSELFYQSEPGFAENISESKPKPSIKLNLKFNEKTGEYEPIGMPDDDISGNSDGRKSRIDRENIKFGLDYDISTDSFGGKPKGHR